MNYIILNGVNSSTINGLLIQSLPPISKPLLRTQIDEIDGKDGDIVTPLGYSAYDKSFEIGLYGDFDIDEVISFFDSFGTVTFSNEPEKYYNYQMIEQIDFERLVRFKTATVTMHIQPFKYSLVDNKKTFTINNQLLSLNNYEQTTNGITLNATNGVITASGTGTDATEFYVPITTLILQPGSYTLSASIDGVALDACSIRLIKNIPSNVDTFGGTYLELQDDSTVTQSAILTETTTYNYVWFYVTDNKAINFTLDLQLKKDNVGTIIIRNNGNTISKPIITVYGSGDVSLNLNDVPVFDIVFGSDNNITIDMEKMEAYNGEILKNRSVTGDYDKFTLNVGRNVITTNGNVTQFDIENFSRWI